MLALFKTISSAAIPTCAKTAKALPVMPVYAGAVNVRAFGITSKKFPTIITKKTTRITVSNETTATTSKYKSKSPAQTSVMVIKKLTNSFKVNKNKSLSQIELKALIYATGVLEPYFSYLIKNHLVVHNKYRWNANEKAKMSESLMWMNKTPKEIIEEDLAGLSLYIKTRDPIQCRRFLDYRIKMGMVSVICACVCIFFTDFFCTV